jgi:hypothetical protein
MMARSIVVGRLWQTLPKFQFDGLMSVLTSAPVLRKSQDLKIKPPFRRQNVNISDGSALETIQDETDFSDTS